MLIQLEIFSNIVFTVNLNENTKKPEPKMGTVVCIVLGIWRFFPIHTMMSLNGDGTTKKKHHSPVSALH